MHTECYDLVHIFLNTTPRKPKRIDASYTSDWREHAYYDTSKGETNISDDTSTLDIACFGSDLRYI